VDGRLPTVAGKREEFPELLFGVATSDHQAESFDPACPDFRDIWEKQQKQTVRGKATDFWNRYAEDIDLARGLGCKLFRFSIAWSRVEPRQGEFDAAALGHYKEIVATIHRAEMLPLATLHHFTWPAHVEERGGLIAQDFPQWYGAYAQEVASFVGKEIPYWITFNEPNLLVYGHVKPWWQTSWLVPPGNSHSLSDQLDNATYLIRNLFISHCHARKIIQSINPAAKVGVNPFVLGVPGELQSFIDWLATRTADRKTFHRQARKVSEQPLLAQTPVDVVISHFTPTANRRKRIAFSHNYASAPQQLVVRRGESRPPEKLGYVDGSNARLTIENKFPAAACLSFATHQEGLAALANNEIDGFVADEPFLQTVSVFPNLEVRNEPLNISEYAIGVPQAQPDLLHVVNATLSNKTPSPHALRSLTLQAIRRRGYLRVGCDTQTCHDSEITRQEIKLAQDLAQQIFGERDRVQIEPMPMQERVPALCSWTRIFDPILKVVSVIGTVLTSNWWHLGMAGKLPEFLCPKECIGQQDFVGLDYYWGINRPEPHRLSQLVDASLSVFAHAPIDPPGLLAVLKRFDRWFPGQDILIIENGCIEKADGFTREDYLRAHIHQVMRARSLGIQVKAYICWSITSNREWGLKFSPDSDFGLYHIDLDSDPDLKRYPTSSAIAYKAIIKAVNRQRHASS
jgi:beta-glucosidase/6-phospho-beta-glucosidase/beta-galactosidase